MEKECKQEGWTSWGEARDTATETALNGKRGLQPYEPHGVKECKQEGWISWAEARGTRKYRAEWRTRVCSLMSLMA